MVQRTHTVGNPNGAYWETLSQSGDDTPPHLRKRGLWPINKYSANREAQTQNFVSLYDQWGNRLNGGPYGVISFGGFSLNPPVLPQEADVINKLGDKWRNTDLDLGMYASPEGRESLGMMITGLQRFTNSARSLRRGDFGGFLRNLNELPRHARKASARKFNQGDLSGSFLAAHLGWEPLIKDVYNASQGVGDIRDKPHRITATKRGFVTGSQTNPALKAQLTSDVFVKLALDITRPPTFAQRFGLDNPFRIAWELVPLSFVADYFLPIGSVVSAMGSVSALYGQRGFRKQLIKVVRKESYPPGSCAISAWYELYYNREEIRRYYSYTRFNRTPWTPSFQDPIKNLRVRLPTSVMKLGTLSALAHQHVLSLAKR